MLMATMSHGITSSGIPTVQTAPVVALGCSASLQGVASLGEDGSKVSRSANLKQPSHDPRHELEDGDLQAKLLQRVSSLEPRNTTTDDDSLLLALSVGSDSIGIALVLDREDALEFMMEHSLCRKTN